MYRIQLLLVIAYRNIWRNQKRSLLAVLSIALGVGSVIFVRSYITGVFTSVLEGLTDFQLGHIKIVDTGYYKEERLNNLSMNIPDTLVIENSSIIHISPRINFGVMLYNEGKNKFALGYAIKKNDAKEILKLDKKVKSGSFFNDEKKNILMGKGLMKKMKLSLNDRILVVTVTSEGGLNAMKFKILGEMDFGLSSFDENMFVVDINDAQNLLRMKNKTTEQLIYIKNIDNADNIAKDLKTDLKKDYIIRTWQEQGDWYKLFQTAFAIYQIFYFIIIALACFVILNTMIMIVFERKKEIGILNAMGLNRIEILSLFWLEGLVLTVLGCIVGAIMGSICSLILGYFGINIQSLGKNVDMPISSVLYPRLNLRNIYVSILIGFVVSCLANLIPARLASKQNAIEAIRG
ncbi:MAG: ABC transporter permease [Candidatus Coatesbacteria bacterium]|nr:ABC transporter permease [Candidatus Coatesbacteria bacterium]